ncbi:hypothetical protein [Modestobacter sp. KNN46-3]|uniref:hypothetical protein n=1 Tax=Modestobacter sp. KNN46-3 TaxID=2711218 RepID=UPI0013E0BD80|nr:hypothetical protein [Modestobacter sp. KNN46-3]
MTVEVCQLTQLHEPACTAPAVVSVRDQHGGEKWGCEVHAAAALTAVEGARVGAVHDWDAMSRLLELPWNTR